MIHLRVFKRQKFFFFFNGRSAYRMRLRKSFLETVIICKFRPIWTGREKIQNLFQEKIAWAKKWRWERTRMSEGYSKEIGLSKNRVSLRSQERQNFICIELGIRAIDAFEGYWKTPQSKWVVQDLQVAIEVSQLRISSNLINNGRIYNNNVR